MLQGLLWNGRQASPWNVLPLDPEFEDYMTRSFSFAPSQGLYGVVLALHVCRSVTLYGFGLSAQQGGWVGRGWGGVGWPGSLLH